MKDFSRVVELPQSVSRVHELLTDRELVEARYAAVGYVKVSIDTATDVRVVSTRTDPDDLPGPLAKLASVSPPVTQTDEWSELAADGSRSATWVIAKKPMPAELSGTIRLVPAGEGTTMTYTGVIKIKVPVLGGRLEPVALGQLTSKLDSEWEWLKSAPPSS